MGQVQFLTNRIRQSDHGINHPIFAFMKKTDSLKAHFCGADWVNKTIKKNRIWQTSVISLYTEIHEDANDQTAFILEAKYDPRAYRLGNCSEAMSFVGDFKLKISQSKLQQFKLIIYFSL